MTIEELEENEMLLMKAFLQQQQDRFRSMIEEKLKTITTEQLQEIAAHAPRLHGHCSPRRCS
jgi:uncharacterized protein YqeY